MKMQTLKTIGSRRYLRSRLGHMRNDKWFDHNCLVNLIPMSSGQLFVCKHEAKFAQQTAGSIVPVLQDGEAG